MWTLNSVIDVCKEGVFIEVEGQTVLDNQIFIYKKCILRLSRHIAAIVYDRCWIYAQYMQGYIAMYSKSVKVPEVGADFFGERS